MYSTALLDHFQNPRNVGQLPPPAETVEVVNPICGDILRFSVLFEGREVVAARYQVRGCTASIAAGSALTEMVIGKARLGLLEITAEDFHDALGELPQASEHVVQLCLDALRKLARRPPTSPVP